MSNIRMSSGEKITLLSNLSTMLRAGIPIAAAVDSLLEEVKGSQQKVLLALQEDLTSGKQISDSFARFPQIFNRVTLNLIKASEESGTLETTLEDMRKTLQEEVEFVDRIKAALFYPMMIGFVLVGVIGLMLFVVIPKISKVFARLNVPMPLPTKIMIGMSALLTENTIPVMAVTAMLVIAFILIFRFRRGWITRVMFAIPGISSLILQIDLTRFTRSMHLLLSSGIPIASALELAEDVISRKDLRDLISSARDQAVAGHAFSDGLRTKQHLIPGMVVKLIEVGEKTGSLDRAMQDVSEHMDYQVTKNLKKITSMMEPIMLIIAGVAVGGLMMSIIAPIYGLIGQFGNR